MYGPLTSRCSDSEESSGGFSSGSPEFREASVSPWAGLHKLRGIVTCEQVQVEKFRNGTNRTDDKGLNYDVWLYSVSNPDDVLTGKYPRMMTIGPFELRKQSSDRVFDGSFTDGEVSYKVGTTYSFRGEEPTEILNEVIVVPNVMYASLITNPLMEEIFLSIVSGMAFKMQGMGIQALNMTLRKMGSFTDTEV